MLTALCSGEQSARWQEIIEVTLMASSNFLNPQVYLKMIKVIGLDRKLIQQYKYICSSWINSCLVQTKKQNPQWFLDVQHRIAMTMRFDYLFTEPTTDAQSCCLTLSPSHF